MSKKKTLIATSAIISLILFNAKTIMANDNVEMPQEEQATEKYEANEPKEIGTGENKGTEEKLIKIIEELSNLLNKEQQQILNELITLEKNPTNVFKEAVLAHESKDFETAYNKYETIITNFSFTQKELSFLDLFKQLAEKEIPLTEHHYKQEKNVSKQSTEDDGSDSEKEFTEEISKSNGNHMSGSKDSVDQDDQDEQEQNDQHQDDQNQDNQNQKSDNSTGDRESDDTGAQKVKKQDVEKTQLTVMSNQVASELTADELYEEAMTAYGASTAWEAARGLAAQYPNDTRVSTAINTAAERLLTLGTSNHEKNNYATALVYYKMILSEELVNSNIMNQTKVYNLQASNQKSLRTADELYEEAMTAYGASTAWEVARELAAYYPNDARVSTAINTAAERLLTLGTSNHKTNNYASASVYYEMILSEELVNSNLSNRVAFYIEQAENNQALATSDKLYEEAMTAYGASTAWEAARDLAVYYPNDTRVSTAINTAAERLLTLGTSNHKKNNYASALVYYEMIQAEPLVNSNLSNRVSFYMEQAENNQALATSDKLYEEAMTAYGASTAWEAAQDLAMYYPNDTRVSTAINTAAERLLTLGTSNHKKNNYASALVYYEMIQAEPLVNLNLSNEVVFYIEQAENNQPLVTSDELYEEAMTAYGASTAWEAAQELVKFFPSDTRVDEAINTVADRLLTLGRDNHRNRNFNTAIYYYDLIMSEVLVDSLTIETVSNISNLADQSLKLYSSIDYYNKSINAYGASEAWNVALQGLIIYPNSSNIQSALDKAANRYLVLGRSHHKKGNKSSASYYYNSVINEKDTSNSLKTLATVFLNQLDTTHRPIVYIDPGHGDHDPGASHHGVYEKILNLNTARYLRNELESRGYIVMMSRNSDVFLELTDRAVKANEVFADVFVSIHYNSMGGSGATKGIETFIHHTVPSGFGQETNRDNFNVEDIRIEESLTLADSIHSNLIQSTNFRDRGVKGNNFGVLRNTYAPAVLLELGFMDNLEELSIIKTSSYQKKAATAIADGIDNYFAGI